MLAWFVEISEDSIPQYLEHGGAGTNKVVDKAVRFEALEEVAKCKREKKFRKEIRYQF